MRKNTPSRRSGWQQSHLVCTLKKKRKKKKKPLRFQTKIKIWNKRLLDFIKKQLEHDPVNNTKISRSFLEFNISCLIWKSQDTWTSTDANVIMAWKVGDNLLSCDMRTACHMTRRLGCRFCGKQRFRQLSKFFLAR